MLLKRGFRPDPKAAFTDIAWGRDNRTSLGFRRSNPTICKWRQSSFYRGSQPPFLNFKMHSKPHRFSFFLLPRNLRNILSRSALGRAGECLFTISCFFGVGAGTPAEATSALPEAGRAGVEMRCIGTPIPHQNLPY